MLLLEYFPTTLLQSHDLAPTLLLLLLLLLLPHSVSVSRLFPQRSCCCSFVLFFLLPAALLLVGAAVQHAWHYGLPHSPDHLLAQLELRRLEGLEGLGLAGEPCSADCR